MSVNTIHKLDNKKKSFLYNCWVKSVVENGLMDEYIILKYPDLVQVRTIGLDKRRNNYKVLPKREAEKIINEHPNNFDFIEIDIEELKLNDFKKSNSIKNVNSIRPVRNRIFYFSSFLLLIPLFSKSVRTTIKRYIDTNINVISFITGMILILLTIYMITKMN